MESFKETQRPAPVLDKHKIEPSRYRKLQSLYKEKERERERESKERERNISFAMNTEKGKGTFDKMLQRPTVNLTL